MKRQQNFRYESLRRRKPLFIARKTQLRKADLSLLLALSLRYGCLGIRSLAVALLHSAVNMHDVSNLDSNDAMETCASPEREATS